MMKKMLGRILTSVITGSFLVCNMGVYVLNAAAVAEPTIVDRNPAVKDCAAADNLFGSNPSLEGDDWWKNSHNWDCSDYGLDTTVKHSGESSLKYSAPEANWDNGLYAPDITVKANTDYTFSFWVRGDVQGGVFGCMLNGDNKIGGNDVTLTPPAFDSEWHQVGYTFNTGDATTIRFTVGPGGGTAYFDDFQLFEVKKSEPSEEQDPYIITTTPEWMNTKSENNIFGSNPGVEGDDWWKNGHNWSCGDYSLDTTVKHGGNSSLKYSAPAANWDNGFYAPDITVKANTDYTFSFWVRGDVQGDLFGCMLYGDVKIGGSGANETVLKPLAFDGEWRQVGYTFNTGKATTIRFTIGPGGGTAYFDDFQLFETAKADIPERDPFIVTTAPDSMDTEAENNIFGSNPGLEGDDWWKNGHNWSCGDYSLDTTVKHGGNSSLKYSAPAANWDNGFYAPDITVKANTNYTFSFWVRGDVQGDLFGCMLYGDVKIGGSGENETVLKPPVFDGKWYQVGYTFNTGKATTIRFTIGPGGGTAYFDDFQLFETTKASEPLEKETSIVSLTPTKTDCADADNLFGNYAGVETADWWSTGHNWGCGAYSRTDETKHGGDYSLKYSESTAHWDDHGYYSPDFAVKKNTNYTFSVWVKGEIQGDAFVCMLTGNDKVGGEYTLVPKSWNNTWHQIAYTFNTGKYTTIRMHFGAGGGTIYYDDFKLFEETKGTLPPEKEGNDPVGKRKVLVDYDCKEEDNLITDSGCETDEYWSSNAQGYGEAVTISDEKPYSGKNSLKFAPDGSSSYIKWFTVTPDTDYNFITMVSADKAVLGDIKYYFVDADGVQIENVFSEQDAGNYVLRGGVDTLLHVPAWDGNWYQRIYQFNTGRETTVGLKITGSKGTLYFDDLKLFDAEDTVLIRETKQAALTMEINPEKSICNEQDNLVKNGDLENGTEGWSDILGYDEYVFSKKMAGNNVLLYEDGQSHAHYMAWFDVKPNTEYTLSYYVQVLQEGMGEVGIFDGSQEKNQLGQPVTFGEAGGWEHYSVTFNSDSLDKVAFYIYDGGGKAAIDKIRLFESSKGIVPTAADVPPEIPIESGDNVNKTGDIPVAGAIALLAASAGAVFTVRKKVPKKQH